jgi:hypothetical protein
MIVEEIVTMAVYCVNCGKEVQFKVTRSELEYFEKRSLFIYRYFPFDKYPEWSFNYANKDDSYCSKDCIGRHQIATCNFYDKEILEGMMSELTSRLEKETTDGK